MTENPQTIQPQIRTNLTSSHDLDTLREIEKYTLENKLQYELLQNQLKKLESHTRAINKTLELSQVELDQSVIEVKNSRLENEQVKNELYDLQQYVGSSVQLLNEKLDTLMELTKDSSAYENIGVNVQLVLDHYINTKFGNNASEDAEEVAEESDDELVDEEMEDAGEDEANTYSDDVEPSEEVYETENQVSRAPVQPVTDFEYINHPQISVDDHGNIKYSLAKDITTVAKIWEEYSRGVNGGPPLRELVERFQTTWKLRNENSTFLRRKKIYKAIEFAITYLNYSEEQAIEELEEHRYDEVENKKRLMYWLYDNIPFKFRPS